MTGSFFVLTPTIKFPLLHFIKPLTQFNFMKTAICVLLLFCFAACNSIQSKEISKAFVYERQELKDGKILLFYRFQSANNLVNDTAIVENTFIPQDSIPVQFNASQPQESKLLFASTK